MQCEYDAHIANNTWTLVSHPKYLPREIGKCVMLDNGKKVYHIKGLWQY